MSTKISKKKFTELVRNLLQKEIEEATTTVSVGDMSYDTPNAFSKDKEKKRREKIAKTGTDFEVVNEAVLTISYQPIFDADKKDKLEKIAKKSGLAIRSRGKQGFTVDGKRANVEKFIKATRGMIEVKEGGPGSGRPKDDTRGNPDDAWDDEEGRAKPSEPDWDIEDDEEAKRQAMADMGIEDDDIFEDTKDIAKAKKLSQKIQQIEGKYRKAMYELSDRLQADPKNHKLQDELIKSYTKHVTSFMKDMIKITKRVK